MFYISIFILISNRTFAQIIFLYINKIKLQTMLMRASFPVKQYPNLI